MRSVGPSSKRGTTLYGALALSALAAFVATPLAIGARVLSDPAGGGPRLFARVVELPALQSAPSAHPPASRSLAFPTEGVVAAPGPWPAAGEDPQGEEELDGAEQNDEADPSGVSAANVDPVDGVAGEDELAPASESGSEGSPRCTSRRRGKRIVRTMQFCPADTTAAIARWRPDTVVVLGGGLVFGGEPGCATSQRAHAAWQLFERLGRRTTLLLSGRGPGEPSRVFDDAGVACERARMAQALADARAHRPWHAVDEERKLARFESSHRGAPTEAEQMCAAIVRHYPRAEWEAVLARLRFENGSRTTIENVRFSTPMLRRMGSRRVLVLSTPVLGRRLDNHPSRALYGFRWARGSESDYALAAVGCPFVNGGPAWSEFEGDFVD